MGFYGNITNTSKTQFQFDRTFPNRFIMDSGSGNDGVYIGRYVLVEYDKEIAADWITIAYKKTPEGSTQPKFYSSVPNPPIPTTEFVIGQRNIEVNKFIRVPGIRSGTGNSISRFDYDENEDPRKDLIYKIVGGELNRTPETVLVTAADSNDNYLANYNTDLEHYHSSRGYDSTVWQKVYADGRETYVMIAELNTVVPTFDVSPDAPTMSPIPPHFDSDSTNIYYKVHWQPTWGFRVKSAYKDMKVMPVAISGISIPGADSISSSAVLENNLPSDENVVWTAAGYDRHEENASRRFKTFVYKIMDKNSEEPVGNWQEYQGTLNPDKDSQIPAAIYYNKSGFNPKIITYSDEDIEDSIKVEASGLSGHSYNTHYANTMRPQVDTQELSIILPSIGNTIAKVWDVLYGGLEENESNIRDTSILWKEGTLVPQGKGLRLLKRTDNGYYLDEKSINTVAGSINSVHDLMGMIIKSIDSLPSDAASLPKDYIYYVKDQFKFYRKHNEYAFTNIANNDVPSHVYFKPTTLTTLDEFLNNCYFREETENGRYNYIKATEFDSSFVNNYYNVTDKVEATFNSDFTSQKENIYEKIERVSDKEVTETVYRQTQDESFNEEHQDIYHRILPDGVQTLAAHTYIYSSDAPIEDITFLRIVSENLVSTPTREEYDEDMYFEKNNGKYTKAKHPDSSFNASKTYYKLVLETVAHSAIAAAVNRQYFVIETNNITSDSQLVVNIVYIREPNVTSSNFVSGRYYVYNATDKVYTVALEFNNSETYYRQERQLTAELVSNFKMEHVHNASLILFTGNRYYTVNVDKEGVKEYTLITLENLPYTGKENIVRIADGSILNTLDGFYVPNMYWYEVETGVLAGSYIVDDASRPTEDRIYYNSIEASKKTNIIPPYESYKYYYKYGDDYILDTRETKSNVDYYTKDGLYVTSDSTGRVPVGTEWNWRVTTVPTEIKLAKRVDKWTLQELEGFGNHYNTIHGLILRLNELLEQRDPNNREFKVAQGLMNRVKDLLVQFGDMYANQIVVTDKFGRLTSTTLKGDEWIKPSYTDRGQIIINHQNTGTVNSQTLEVKANATTTVPFGGSFTSPSFSLGIDAAGHTDSFSTSNNTLTLPTITFSGVGEGNVVSELTMSGAGTTAITFTKTKMYLGSVKLGAYTAIDKDVLEITSETTLASAINKISTHINGLDYSMTAAANTYVSAVTEKDGKISVSTASTSDITSLGTITSGTWNSAIAKDRVTTDSIKDEAVTDDKLASGIDASKLTTGTLPADRIANNSIASGKIISLEASKLTGTLSMDRIGAKAITSEKINSLDASKLTGTLSMDRIGAETITNAKLASGIVGTKVVLTGYSAQSATNVIATDSVNVAIAKLEAKIADLQSQINNLTTT